MNPHLPLTQKVTATYQYVRTVNGNDSCEHKADWPKLWERKCKMFKYLNLKTLVNHKISKSVYY
jgi:hypothetical protein